MCPFETEFEWQNEGYIEIHLHDILIPSPLFTTLDTLKALYSIWGSPQNHFPHLFSSKIWKLYLINRFYSRFVLFPSKTFNTVFIFSCYSCHNMSVSPLYVTHFSIYYCHIFSDLQGKRKKAENKICLEMTNTKWIFSL